LGTKKIEGGVPGVEFENPNHGAVNRLTSLSDTVKRTFPLRSGATEVECEKRWLMERRELSNGR